MRLIINTKTKKEEKVVKDFLTSRDIDFQTKAEEDAAPYKSKPKKTLSQKEKNILNNLDESVDFVKKYKKGKTKAKSLLFHAEAEEDTALGKAMEKGRKSRLLTSKEKTSFLGKLKSAK